MNHEMRIPLVYKGRIPIFTRGNGELFVALGENGGFLLALASLDA